VKIRSVAGTKIYWLAALAVAGLAAVVWAIVVPRTVFYLAGLALLAPMLAVGFVDLLVRRTPRRLIAWPAGVLAAAVVLAVAIVVPKAVLAAQVRSDLLWTAAMDEQGGNWFGLETWVIGDRIYVTSEDTSMRSFDRHTGQLLATFPAAKSTAAAVAADGSVVGWKPESYGAKATVTYYAPDGRVLWTKPWEAYAPIDGLEGRTPVVAATSDVAVLANCLNYQFNQGDRLCTWIGVDRTGHTVWTQHQDGQAAGTGGGSLVFAQTHPPLPSVLVGRQSGPEKAEYVVRSAADGHVLTRRPGDPSNGVALRGDLAVFAEHDKADRCQLVGFRAGHQVVSTTGLPCARSEAGDAWPGVLRVVGARAYLDDQKSGGQTVSLVDGSWRTLSVPLNGSQSAPLALGADVIVQFQGRTLTGTDAASGKVLWRKQAPGPVTEAKVDNGGVFVAGDPPGHNPFLSRWSQKFEYRRVTAWDARTGRRTANLLIGGPSFTNVPVGAGQILAVDSDMRRVRLIGAF
jgi:outer membrane protein assembly factor BamB